jgi:hypothetical protein
MFDEPDAQLPTTEAVECVLRVARQSGRRRTALI